MLPFVYFAYFGPKFSVNSCKFADKAASGESVSNYILQETRFAGPSDASES
jgi:hypothetical protein